MRKILLTTAFAFALYAPALAAAPDDAPTFEAASLDAGENACGGIELWDIGECHFEFDGGCQASCEPVSFSICHVPGPVAVTRQEKLE